MPSHRHVAQAGPVKLLRRLSRRQIPSRAIHGRSKGGKNHPNGQDTVEANDGEKIEATDTHAAIDITVRRLQYSFGCFSLILFKHQLSVLQYVKQMAKMSVHANPWGVRSK